MEKDSDIITLTSSTLSATDAEQQPGTPAATPASPRSSKASPARLSVTGEFSNIADEYVVDPNVIGAGRNGSVRACVRRSTGERFAVKTIRKTDSNVGSGRLAREIELLREVRHPGVVRLVDVREDGERLHLVTELCAGGELFHRIKETSRRREGGGGAPCFEEGEAAGLLRQVLAAVSHMHRRGVVHRDLKPENVLLADADGGGDGDGAPLLKIVDFGHSRRHAAGEAPMRAVVGTSYYTAPEVLRGKYDRSCDLWSVGVIAYVLLRGRPPFRGGTNEEVRRSILGGRDPFLSEAEDWSGASGGARSFVRRLLERDPTRRMTAEQALNHPWMAKHIDDDPSTSDEVVRAKPSLKVMFSGIVRKRREIRRNVSGATALYRAARPHCYGHGQRLFP